MIVGGYTLDLYCDNRECPNTHNYLKGDWWPRQYVGQSGRSLRAEAKRDGWKMDHEMTLCPDCHKVSRQQEHKNERK